MEGKEVLSDEWNSNCLLLLLIHDFKYCVILLVVADCWFLVVGCRGGRIMCVCLNGSAIIF